MQQFIVERKNVTDENLAGHVAAFTSAAGEALSGSDTDEVWNAAFNYAQEANLSSHAMTRILTAVRAKGHLSAAVLNEWLREGAAALGEVTTRVPPQGDDVMNRQLHAHAHRITWQYDKLLVELCRWAERFIDAFFDQRLPPPAISIARSRSSNLGTYQLKRDGLGLKHRININEKRLKRGFDEILRTLLHELIHEWEEVEHGRKTGGAYHTKTFRAKALSLGIPTDDEGHSLGIVDESPFTRLLKQYGVARGVTWDGKEVKTAVAAEAGLSHRPQRQKWFCGCTTIWANTGITVKGRCERCHNIWVRHV